MKHDTPHATLTDAERAALAALTDSPLGRQIREAAEDERAAKRREILAKLHGTAAELRETTTQQSAEALRLRPKAEAAFAAWQTVLHALIAAEAAASDASTAAEHAEARALRELFELGTRDIDATVRELIFIESDARNAVDWRVAPAGEPDMFGRRKSEPRERFPGMLDFVARLRELRAELEALKLSSLTPAEIAARCKAAVDEARGPTIPPLPDSEPGKRALAVGPGMGVRAPRAGR